MNVGTLEIKLLANLARLQTDMDRANQTVDRAMGKINKSVATAKNAFGGLTAAFGGAQILRMLDEYKKFDAQLKISTRSTKEYAAAYKSVVDIARQSQSDISAVGVFYARLTNNLRDFGTTQKEIAGITEAVALSLRVSNATVQETNSVMLQLSQSFGSGRINGQEFLAVSEGAPIIMRQLAKSLNTTVGALKDMSAAGQLTSDVLAKALADPEYITLLREQVKEVGTISSAWTVFMNNLKQYLGEADKTKGASDLIRKGILALGDSLNTLVTVGLAAAGVAFARWVTSLYESAKAQAALIARQQAAANQKVVLARAAVILAEAEYRAASAIGASTLALNNNAAATTNAARADAALTVARSRLAATTATATATVGLFGRTIAFLGGPIGIAIAGVVLFGDKIVEWINKTRGMTPALKAINDELDRQNKLRERGISIKDPLAEEKSEVQDLQKAIADLTAQRKRYQEIAKNPDVATFGERTVLGATGDSVQKRASDLAVDTQNRLRIAYEKLADAQKVVTTENVKQTASFAELTEGLKLASEQAAEYEKQSKLIREAGLREGKTEAQIAEALTALKVKLLGKETASTKEAQDALKDYFERTNKAIIEQIELREKMYRDDEQYVADMANVQVDATQAIYDQIDALREELANRGKLESAIQSSILARTIEKRVAMEAAGLNVEAIEDEIAARKKFLDLIIKKERIEAEEEAAEESKRIWEEAEEKRRREQAETAKELSRSITDALMRGFEDGKSIAQNFRETLKNMFNTLILRPVIEAIVKPVAGALGGIFSTNAFAGTGGGGGFNGLLSQGKSLLDAVQNGFSGLNNSLTSAIGDLGTFLSTGNGGLGDVLGGFIGQYSSQIASALPFAGAAFSLLTGDIKGAVSQGIGAGIGVAIGGPVGGLIGSALGSVVGGLFGGSGERFKQQGDSRAAIMRDGKITYQQKDFSGAKFSGTSSPLDRLNEAFLKNYTGLLEEFGLNSDARVRSTIRLRRTSGRLATSFYLPNGGGRLDKEFGGDGEMEKSFKKFTNAVMGEYLAKAIRQSDLPDGIRSLFSGLTKQGEVVNMINATVALNRAQVGLTERFGLTTNEAAKVAKELGYTNQALADFVNKFAELGRGYMTTGQVILQVQGQLEKEIGDLPDSLKEFDAALKAIDTTTKSGIVAFADLFSMRDQFAAFTASIDSLKSNVRGAIFSMVSDQEKLEMQREDMAKIFTELGYAIPGSIQELVALGKSIDFTTEEGLNLAAVFPTLVQAFNAVGGAATELQDALNPNNFSTLTDFIRANAYRNNGIPMSMLPSYDVGTSYVPRTGPAIIHAGERILTASENRSFTQSSADLVAEVRALGAKVAELLRSSDDTAKNTRKTSDLLTRVTEDGRVMLTEAMA